MNQYIVVAYVNNKNNSNDDVITYNYNKNCNNA